MLQLDADDHGLQQEKEAIHTGAVQLFNEHGPRRQSNEDEHGVRAEHDGTNTSSSWQSEQRVLHTARPTQQQVQGRAHLAAQFNSR